MYLHSYLYLISVSELVSIYCYFMTPTTTSRSTAAAIATTTAITILLGHLRHTKSYPEEVAQPSIASRGKSMHAIGFRREEARSRMKVRMTNACKRAISIAITCIVCQATLLATRDPRRQHLLASRTSETLRVHGAPEKPRRPTVCSRLAYLPISKLLSRVTEQQEMID